MVERCGAEVISTYETGFHSVAQTIKHVKHAIERVTNDSGFLSWIIDIDRKRTLDIVVRDLVSAVLSSTHTRSFAIEHIQRHASDRFFME
jgi:hypothetical protein